MSNHPNRSRIVIAANGDEYHINGNSREGFDVRLWNAHFGAWVEEFNPEFRTLAAAREYIAERVA